jgi:beta-exotoxin I transport system permease protein
MNAVLLRRTITANVLRLVVVAVALAFWGALMPIIYAEFGSTFRDLLQGGAIPEQFRQAMNFGGGDITQLQGVVTIGFIHPLAVALLSVFAIGFTVAAVAGERQRGTLEVLLARPISRRGLYGTMLVATLFFLAVSILAMLLGVLGSSAAWGLLDDLETANLPLLWLNGLLLYVAIGSIALAASVSFDRLAPALALTLAIVLVSYFLQVLGSLWPDADFLQPYSLFYYLKPQRILEGQADPFDLGLLATVAAVAVAYALVVFPRRDLAAPS